LFSTDVPLIAIAVTANTRVNVDISKRIRKVINNLRFNFCTTVRIKRALQQSPDVPVLNQPRTQISFHQACRQIRFYGSSLIIICQRGEMLLPSPSSVHCVKSMGSLQALQVCGRSNSSENISLLSPHLGHLQVKDLSDLKFAYPGQCCGVDVVSAIITSI
jgi:hypothetical protein